MEKRLRKTHIRRLNQGECTPQAGVNFIDIISHYTRVADHAMNLAEKSTNRANLRNVKQSKWEAYSVFVEFYSKIGPGPFTNGSESVIICMNINGTQFLQWKGRFYVYIY